MVVTRNRNLGWSREPRLVLYLLEVASDVESELLDVMMELVSSFPIMLAIFSCKD
jgi:hypothetical protein